MVAQVLGIPHAAVTVNMRRMGGGFGGKETQGNLFAVVAALAAKKLNRAVKIRPDRDDDFQITGKRHDFVVDYDVGYNSDGRIQAVNADLCGALRLFRRPLRPGHRPRAVPRRQRLLVSGGAGELAAALHQHLLQHRLPRLRRPAGHHRGRALDRGHRLRAGQGPARDPQGAISTAPTADNVTPYHQVVEDNVIHRIIDELEQSSRLPGAPRRRSSSSTATSRVLKKGIALTPVKFGISFTATWHNQAGALVHVYRDGSVHLSHGGTEMGQGLHIKVAQVVADAFGIGARPGEDHRLEHRQGAQHLGHRRLLRHRPQRHGGARRLQPDQGAHGRACGQDVRGRARRGAVGVRRHPLRQAVRAVRGAGDLVLDEPRPALAPPASTRRRRSTGTARAAAATRSTISPMAPAAPR